MKIDLSCGVLTVAAFGANVGQRWSSHEGIRDTGTYFSLGEVSARGDSASFKRRVDGRIGEITVPEESESKDEVGFC